jgi:hypothetical protein
MRLKIDRARKYVGRLVIGGALMVGVVGCESGSFVAPEDFDLAALSVTPPSLVMAGPGETVQLEVEARDSSSNTIQGVSLKWSSSDPSIATVDDMGRVTAKAPGKVTLAVTALCCAVSASAQVTVQPGGSSAPREVPIPAGGVWVMDSFETGDLSHSENGFRWTNDWGRPSTDYAYSGTHSLKFAYTGTPRAVDRKVEQRFQLADPEHAPSEVWFEYMVRVPENYHHRDEWNEWGHTVGSVTAGSDVLRLDDPSGFQDVVLTEDVPVDEILHPTASKKWAFHVPGAGVDGADKVFAAADYISPTEIRLAEPAATTVNSVRVGIRNGRSSKAINNKFLALWAGADGYNKGGERAITVLETHRGVHNDNAGPTASSNIDVPIGTGAGEPHGGIYNIIERPENMFTAADRGTWIQVRIHLKIGNPGKYEVWKNGRKLWETPDGFRTSEGEGYDFYSHGYLFGWSNTGFDEDTRFYVDDFTVYVADPGWE